jgi:hypothetical protein
LSPIIRSFVLHPIIHRAIYISHVVCVLHKRIFLYFLIPSPPFARFRRFSPLAPPFKVNYADSRTGPGQTTPKHGHCTLAPGEGNVAHQLAILAGRVLFLSLRSFRVRGGLVQLGSYPNPFVCIYVLHRKPLRCKLKYPSGRDSLHPRTDMFRVKKIKCSRPCSSR